MSRQNVLNFVRHALLALRAHLPPHPPRVLEFGSYQVEDQPTARAVAMEVLPDCEYIGADARPGPGVDVVHDMEEPELATAGSRGPLNADVVLCLDTLEHVKHPWRAMRTLVASMVKRRGWLIVAVPFMFRIHDYPSDYWRFTPEGLRLLLCDALSEAGDDGETVPLILTDPAAGVVPRAVVAVVHWCRDLVNSHMGLLDAPWRTDEAGGNQHTVALAFDTQAQADAFLAQVQPWLGGGVRAPVGAVESGQTTEHEEHHGLPVSRQQLDLRLDHQDVHAQPVADGDLPERVHHPEVVGAGVRDGAGRERHSGARVGGHADLRPDGDPLALDPGRPGAQQQLAPAEAALPDPLMREYERLCRLPSDINEHLPILRQLASSATQVVELGMRTGVSTVALLAGHPRRLLSVDVDERAIDATCDRLGGLVDGFWNNVRLGRPLRADDEPPEHLARRYDCGRGPCPLPTGRMIELVRGSSLEVELRTCDLLFIDTLHTRDQLEAELQRWSDSVRKLIVLHDTVTYGRRGEDGREPGLLAAVAFWLRQGKGQKKWRLRQHYLNNNGLMVLERYA